MAKSLQQLRAGLRIRLEARWPEIEEAATTRVYAISDPFEVRDPEYIESLRPAVGVALEYGRDAIGCGEGRVPEVPPALLAQARMAARNGVTLSTVVRRYCAGYGVLGEFVIKEAEDGGLLDGASLQRILRGQAAALDHLIAAISEEHDRTSNERATTTSQHRADYVKKLLAGELIDASGLAYNLDSHHLAAIAGGPGAEEAVHKLAASLDARPLKVRRDDGTILAWLGSQRGIDHRKFMHLAHTRLPPHVFLALGEPAHGLPGWRFSHHQARAVLTIARHRPGHLTCYSDYLLLAPALHDEILARSLLEIFLAPLEGERDGGAALQRTLRAYFGARFQVTSTASALSVSRQTVTKHLRTVENLVGRSVDSCAAELQTALRLQELADKGLFKHL